MSNILSGTPYFFSFFLNYLLRIISDFYSCRNFLIRICFICNTYVKVW